MGSDDSDDEGGDDTAAALNNIVQPLRKQIKKMSGKIDKLTSSLKSVEAEAEKEAAARIELEAQLAEARTLNNSMKSTLDANPWRFQGEQLENQLRATEKRLSESMDEQRVQLAAHGQVFQTTQTTVSQLAQVQSTLQAAQTDGARATAEETRSLTARIDHMRGEFSERVSHSFAESTSHADRLGQRLQEDVHRLDGELSLRAQSKSVAESNASLQAEISEVRSSVDELRKELRVHGGAVSELKELQSGFALKSSLAGTAATSEQRIITLEDGMARLEAGLRETDSLLNDGNFGKRQGLLETRQVRLERELKQLEQQITSCGNELALRPLKTDVISAIAQQELAVEACASKEAVEKLGVTVGTCAQQQALQLVDEAVKAATAQLSELVASVGELRDTTATKQALSQRAKELEATRAKLDEKLGRDECAGMLAAKLDKAEARGILQQQDQLAGQVVGAEAHARRLQDSLSTTNSAALDAAGMVKQMSSRLDALATHSSALDGKLNQRKIELGSITQVVRLMLEDAEMRCAIDEAEGATAAEATDVLQRLRGVGHRGTGGPMQISGVTLHKPPEGYQLTPMPPGAAANDKVWYKQSLQPRSELLGARRRMLVNARHSWVGENCLARDGMSSAPGGGAQLKPTPPGTSMSAPAGVGTPEAPG